MYYMAKIEGSPLGVITGSMGTVTGSKWKGINVIRIRKGPTQRGTSLKLNQYIKGYLLKTEFSYKQFNLRHIVVNLLGTIARQHLEDIINIQWSTLATERHWRMTGSNAFLKANVGALFASFSDPDEQYDPDTNAPNLREMLVSDGDLEPAAISSGTYDQATGEIVVTWSSITYQNGLATDSAKIIIVRKPIINEITWKPTLIVYGPYACGTRGVPEAVTATIPAGLACTDLIAYIYFTRSDPLLDCSPSENIPLTPVL